MPLTIFDSELIGRITHAVTGARPFYDLTNPVIYQRDEAIVKDEVEKKGSLPSAKLLRRAGQSRSTSDTNERVLMYSPFQMMIRRISRTMLQTCYLLSRSTRLKCCRMRPSRRLYKPRCLRLSSKRRPNCDPRWARIEEQAPLKGSGSKWTRRMGARRPSRLCLAIRRRVSQVLDLLRLSTLTPIAYSLIRHQ